MTDAVRSALMGRIRGKETEPEILLRKALWKRGLRYRKNARTPVGRPDIVVASRKLAVFVDGCFWHGCPDHYVRPRSRAEFWAAKLKENVERDVRQVAELEALGWTVVRVWEHEVMEDVKRTAEAVLRGLEAGRSVRPAAWRVHEVIVVDEGADAEERSLVDLYANHPPQRLRQRRHTRKWRRPAPPIQASSV